MADKLKYNKTVTCSSKEEKSPVLIVQVEKQFLKTTVSPTPRPDVQGVLIKEESDEHSSIREPYSILGCQVSVRNRRSKPLEVNKLFSIKDLFVMVRAFISTILRDTDPLLTAAAEA